MNETFWLFLEEDIKTLQKAMSLNNNVSEPNHDETTVDFDVVKQNQYMHCPVLVIRHFPNSSLHQPSVFSCAVDCFLELGYGIFAKYLQNIARSDFFELLLICGSTEFEEDDSSYVDLLCEIREPIWQRIMTSCPTFRNQDCNAQFSELFSSEIFRSLTEEEKLLFETEYTLMGTCETCGISRVFDIQVIVNYISGIEYSQLLTASTSWPSVLLNDRMDNSVQCFQCQERIPAHIDKHRTADVLFVEFSSRLSHNCVFVDKITVLDSHYILAGMVRHDFTCAVLLDTSYWVFWMTFVIEKYFMAMLLIKCLARFSTKDKQNLDYIFILNILKLK